MAKGNNSSIVDSITEKLNYNKTKSDIYENLLLQFGGDEKTLLEQCSYIIGLEDMRKEWEKKQANLSSPEVLDKLKTARNNLRKEYSSEHKTNNLLEIRETLETSITPEQLDKFKQLFVLYDELDFDYYEKDDKDEISSQEVKMQHICKDMDNLLGHEIAYMLLRVYQNCRQDEKVLNYDALTLEIKEIEENLKLK